ncbi:hypothetical protein K474DRAFT_1638856 [Panus rudis PR-1116 ss-1]|nr:hypothetical protein K474DRAFT_1638856 [Panus rudis PR-1116 ss-1]
MSLNAHDNTVLVAPRPVRLAAPSVYTQFTSSGIHRPQPRTGVCIVSAPSDALDRLRLGDDSPEDELKSEGASSLSDRESASQRASPRSTLPSEALEEFLSILRPSSAFLFQPTSPILRASKANVTSAYFPYRRPPSCAISPSLPSEGLGFAINDDVNRENESMTYPRRYLAASPLASPIARSLTRNPFQRHPSYESAPTTFISSVPSTPSPIPSPAAIPLPPPTPNEVDLDL